MSKKALDEVMALISERERLIKHGWKRVANPPLVGNEMIWQHPQWHVQLQSQAIKILDSEDKK